MFPGTRLQIEECTQYSSALFKREYCHETGLGSLHLLVTFVSIPIPIPIPIPIFVPTFPCFQVSHPKVSLFTV